MPAETVVIEHSDENQFLLLFQNLFFTMLDYVASFAALIIHYSITPPMLVYSFWIYAVDQIWQISKQLFNEIRELSRIIPLAFEIWFWSAMIIMEMILFLKKPAEIGMEVQQRIYQRIKTILTILNGLPMTPKHAASLYAALKKIPVWGKALPFPNFLFEQTFKKVGFRRGAVSMILTSQDPDSDEEQQGTQSSTTDDDSKPSILKKPSFKTSKSDERLPKIPDEPTTEEQSESATPIPSSSF